MKRELKKKVFLYSIIITVFFILSILSFFYFNNLNKNNETEILFNPHCDFNFHGCINLTQKGATYCVNNIYGPVVVNETAGLTENSCVNFGADDITLWCLNEIEFLPSESMRTNTTITGMRVAGRNNIKIEGCNFNYWNGTAFLVRGSNNIKIGDVSIENSGNGLLIEASSNVNMSINNLRRNNIGVKILASWFNLYGNEGSSISLSKTAGIDIDSSDIYRNNIINLTLSENNIGIKTVNSNVLLDNSILYNNLLGIHLKGNNSIFKNSLIQSDSRNSVGLKIDSQGTFRNTFYNNLFKNFNNFDLNINWVPVLNNNNFNLTKTKDMNIIGGLFSGGNFWGDVNGYGWSEYASDCNDIEGDGICNNAYKTYDGKIIDAYPLSMNPIWTGCNKRIKNYSDGNSISWYNGEVYCLENSINLTGSDPFLEIKAHGVTIDCNGYRIYSNNKNYNKAIKVNDYENVTIRNCIIENLTSSSSSASDYVSDYLADTSSYGVFSSGSKRLNLSSLVIREMNSSSIKIISSDGSFITDLDIRNVSYSGVIIHNSKNLSLNNINVRYSNTNAIYLSKLIGSSIKNVYVESSNKGINLFDSYNNSFLDIEIIDNFNSGISFIETYNGKNHNNSFENIEISGIRDNSGYGIYLNKVSDNYFNKISLFNNNCSGFNAFDTRYNLFYDLDIRNNKDSILNKSVNNTFIRLSFVNNNGSFIIENNLGGITRFYDSVFERNTGSGFFISANVAKLFLDNINSNFNKKGIFIYNSKNVLINNSNINDNEQEGILISGITEFNGNNNIYSSSILRNNNGISIINSTDNNITNSSISNNKIYGILLGGNSNNIFSNKISDNFNIGLVINQTVASINNNNIFNNYFKNNNNSVIFGSFNGINNWNTTRNDSKLNFLGNLGIGGNYWSDYSNCNNTNVDSFCDEVYPIFGENKDFLPITQYQTSPTCINIDSCNQNLRPYNCYNLNTSLIINSGSCFNISGQNIVLDCQNNIIDGNNSASIGINISGIQTESINSGIKIKRCKINNFVDSGISINIIDGVIIESSELTGNNRGLFINSDNNFVSAYILNSKQDAIKMSGIGNTLSSVSVSGTNSSFYDLYLQSSDNTNIDNSAINKIFVSSDRLKISKSNEGEIKFNDPVSGLIFLNSDIKFSPNLLLINQSNQAIINKQATIRLFGVNAGISRVLLRNNSICNSSTNPSCVLNSDIVGTSISFNTSKIGNFNVKGYSLTLTSYPSGRINNNSTLFSFNLSLTPGTDVINCTLLIDNVIEKIFNNSEVNDGEEVNYVYNISVKDKKYYWNFSCINNVNQPLKFDGWFNSTSSSNNGGGDSTNNNNNNNNNNNGNSYQNTNCAWITNGKICNSNQQCVGTITAALDTNRCCIGNCVDSSNENEEENEKDENCDFMCNINKFFSNRVNLIITLVVIGIIILLILILFIYSFRNKESSDKIRIFQEQSRGQQSQPSMGLSQYSPVQPRPFSNTLPNIQRKVQSSASSPKQNDADLRNNMAINASRLSLRNYILKETKKGVGEADLREALSKANWKESEINSAFNDVKKFLDKQKGSK